MADPAANLKPRFIPILPVDCPAPWEACLVPVTEFPMPAGELGPLRDFLDRFATRAETRPGFSTEVFVQMAQLHLGDGPARLADHGREWIPAVGLGVWPDREPPTIWTKEDFDNLGPGEAPRNIMYQVFRVTTGAAGCDSARNTMFGLGTILQCIFTGDPQALLDRARQLLLPPIKDPVYRAFSYYIPLLDCASLKDRDAAQLDSWFCGASLYIRESAEDKGLLIVSREPLAPQLEALGAHRAAGREPGWRFPIPE